VLWPVVGTLDGLGLACLPELRPPFGVLVLLADGLGLWVGVGASEGLRDEPCESRR